MVRQSADQVSGCPNSCGQHWIGDIGFYGNARKIDGKEVPYYLMLLGGTQHEFGVAIQSLPARLAPVAVERVLDHYKEHRAEGETFRAIRPAPQSGDFPQADCGSGEACRSVTGDVPGLGRRCRLFAGTRPRRVRGVRRGARTPACSVGTSGRQTRCQNSLDTARRSACATNEKASPKAGLKVSEEPRLPFCRSPFALAGRWFRRRRRWRRHGREW